MIRAVLAFMVLTTTAMGETLCTDLNRLDSGDLVLAQGVAECRPSLGIGGVRTIHCMLEYPYRSQAATETFEALLHDLTLCLGPTATQTMDQIVNHPDAYELREFDLRGRVYAVSIKDKGALQQTLVFVRVQMQQP